MGRDTSHIKTYSRNEELAKLVAGERICKIYGQQLNESKTESTEMSRSKAKDTSFVSATADEWKILHERIEW